MPGSWEYTRPQVLVAILTRGLVPSKWSVGFRQLRIPGGVEPVWLSGMPFDHARNVGCERALEHNFEWLFFLDDDVIPPSDAIEKLISRGCDVVSGLYYRRADPIAPVMMREVPGGRAWVTSYQAGQMLEVDYAGAGCLLIHERVLKTMKKPWFEWTLDREDLEAANKMSEDFMFCKKAKALGFKVMVDTSVQCEHAGLGSSINGQFVPLNF